MSVGRSGPPSADGIRGSTRFASCVAGRWRERGSGCTFYLCSGSLLEALQRRSSDVWPAYGEQLGANPDAISLSRSFIDNGWVGAAVVDNHTAVGFSMVMPADAVVH